MASIVNFQIGVIVATVPSMSFPKLENLIWALGLRNVLTSRRMSNHPKRCAYENDGDK